MVRSLASSRRVSSREEPDVRYASITQSGYHEESDRPVPVRQVPDPAAAGARVAVALPACAAHQVQLLQEHPLLFHAVLLPVLLRLLRCSTAARSCCRCCEAQGRFIDAKGPNLAGHIAPCGRLAMAWSFEPRLRQSCCPWLPALRAELWAEPCCPLSALQSLAQARRWWTASRPPATTSSSPPYPSCCSPSSTGPSNTSRHSYATHRRVSLMLIDI